MPQTTRRDNGAFAKGGFALGVTLFLLGVLGEALGPAFVGPLPGWADMLLTDMEALGILLALLAPLVFAIILPLVE